MGKFRGKQLSGLFINKSKIQGYIKVTRNNSFFPEGTLLFDETNGKNATLVKELHKGKSYGL